MPPAETTPLAAIAERADRLYSPPAVALEVLRLTDEPSIDARAICRCVESDPALASKLLRVVNSSLYGLPQEVASLSQAIALLGVQPLKLLVLGFALPAGLTDTLTGDALRRYWTETLTIAAAARRFAETGWGRFGDEALAAGLMQGVGQLALLGQLGDDYAKLLEATAIRTTGTKPPALAPIEKDAFGFDHRELSAALVRRWRLPPSIADAIGRQADESDRLDDLSGDAACLTQSLRLANLLSRMVLRHELGVLPALVECGNRYCGLTQRQLNTIVEGLQSETALLAKANSAPLLEGIDFQKALVEANARMAFLTEQSAVRMMGDSRTDEELDQDEKLCRDLLLETRRLSSAVRVMLAGGLEPRNDKPVGGPEASRPRAPHVRPASPLLPRAWLVEKTDREIAACREQRTGLTLSIIQVSSAEPSIDVSVLAIREWLAASRWADDFENATWAPLLRNRSAVWMPGGERNAIKRLWTGIANDLAEQAPLRLDVGVAGVTQPSRSFDSDAMLEAAQRCLAGAVSTATQTVKSIEVF